MVPCRLVQILHALQKFERLVFCKLEMRDYKYGVEVSFNVMTSLLIFIIIY
jgi:hypothetical protein